MRLSGRLKLGYFPLPPAEGEKIRNLLQFGPEPASVIDPCVGTGAALQQITKGGNCRLYGIELDAARAATAAAAGITTIQGSTFDTHSKVERFSLLYLNPPYDSEIGSLSNRRMEELFLDHTFRWLRIGGVLVFVIPFERLERVSMCCRRTSQTSGRICSPILNRSASGRLWSLPPGNA